MKKLITILLVSLLATSFLAGCSKKTSPNGDGLGDGSLSESDLNAKREGRFGDGSIPTAEGGGMFRDVHFDYDSSVVSSEARQDLEFNAQVLQEKSGLRIQIEGHTDERGTAEYNLALGSSRARSVKDVLVSLGVSASRMETISYGEEVPLDPGHSEAAYSKNRRAHLSPFEGK